MFKEAITIVRKKVELVEIKFCFLSFNFLLMKVLFVFSPHVQFKVIRTKSVEVMLMVDGDMGLGMAKWLISLAVVGGIE